MMTKQPTMKTRIDRAIQYDDELNRLEISPNGDDYTAIINFLCGIDYHPPHTSGR